MGGIDEEIGRQFRLAMRRFAAAVTVVTTRWQDADVGMTATAVTSLSMDPPSLLVCVNRGAGFHSAIEDCESFCVNLLRAGQHHISANFGGAKPPEDRFSEGEWEDSGSVPYLKDAQANIFCRKTALFEYGTHSIVIGEATRLLTHEEIAPLLYVDGRYAAVAPKAG
jgi:flavin reductase (DIM6/NTAB) family NADH-FMN oxidoreductase RutF